jgi:hypothetical protein
MWRSLNFRPQKVLMTVNSVDPSDLRQKRHYKLLVQCDFFQERKQGMDDLVKKMKSCVSQHGIETVGLNATLIPGPIV